jgi:YD repeat-containing protein
VIPANLTETVDCTGQKRTLHYDRFDRVLEEIWSDSGVPLPKITFAFDAVGNLMPAYKGQFVRLLQGNGNDCAIT